MATLKTLQTRNYKLRKEIKFLREWLEYISEHASDDCIDPMDLSDMCVGALYGYPMPAEGKEPAK
jgi:hypothetical protein